VHYPGQIVADGTTDDERRVYNRDTLEHMMRKPFALAERLGLPLYCGEFGVINKSPVPDKLNWYNDMVAIFEKHNVAYANWNYKAGSFGIVDQNLSPDWPMIEALVPR
jgi:endoglucanase